MKLHRTLLASLCLTTILACEEIPARVEAMGDLEHSPTTEQHAWLQQLAGEWETEAHMETAPGEQPMAMKGHESARMLGDLWLVAQMHDDPMEFEAVLTLGYDETTKRFIGTWVDSMTNYMWHYDGSIDSAGRTLTLETQGPNFTGDGAIVAYKDVYELASPDHKVLTSWMKDPGGQWVQLMSADYRRVK